MSEPLIAEDLLLLLTDDKRGKVRNAQTSDLALGGALLIELALAGRVRITDESAHEGDWVTVVDPSSTDDALLDQALARLSQEPGREPQEAVKLLAKTVRRPLQDRLVERGLLRHESTRFAGFNKWPAADSHYEDRMRAGLHRVMVDNEEPTTRQAALIALLAALGVIVQVAAEAGHTLDREAAERRANDLMEQNWASAAVREAVHSVQSATAAAIMGGGASGRDGSES